MFLYKNLFFFNIFCDFNPNHAYWNQWRLFSGNLPGMFSLKLTFFKVEVLCKMSLLPMLIYELFIFGTQNENTKNDTNFSIFKLLKSFVIFLFSLGGQGIPSRD